MVRRFILGSYVHSLEKSNTGRQRSFSIFLNLEYFCIGPTIIATHFDPFIIVIDDIDNDKILLCVVVKQNGIVATR